MKILLISQPVLLTLAMIVLFIYSVIRNAPIALLIFLGAAVVFVIILCIKAIQIVLDI